MRSEMKSEKIGTSELWHCDCMELMARYPDGHFDLAIVDPPYGIGAENGTGRYAKLLTYENKKWDKRPGKNYFCELMRVSKNQIIWGGNYFKLPANSRLTRNINRGTVGSRE